MNVHTVIKLKVRNNTITISEAIEMAKKHKLSNEYIQELVNIHDKQQIKLISEGLDGEELSDEEFSDEEDEFSNDYSVEQPTLEEVIADPRVVVDWLESLDGDVVRWPEAEPYIMKEPFAAYSYADMVIQDRWPEAEPYIMKNASAAFHYALNVIQDRWPEAEPYIMKDPNRAYSYAFNVIKDRWPEAEPYIMKDPNRAYSYALNVIKGRWPEAEPYIMKSVRGYEDFVSRLEN